MSNDKTDDLRPEYPPELIRSGVRGKYAKQFREGSNVVLIDPDLIDAFPNVKAVNDALRRLLAKREESATKNLIALQPAAGESPCLFQAPVASGGGSRSGFHRVWSAGCRNCSLKTVSGKAFARIL